MDDVMIRFWQERDIPDLQKIFTVSFADPPEIAEAFHRIFLKAPETCTLAAVPEKERPEGRPVAAAYCIPGATLHLPERRIESVYLYAFGCLPEWRGRGIAKQVYTAVFEESKRRAPVSCIIPATDGLLQAYNRTGFTFVPLGRIRTAEVSGAEARKAEALTAERIPWQEYARRREEWLRGCPHAEYPESHFRLMEAYGNILLAMDGAVAAVIPLEDRCVVSELLCRGADPARALAGIAGACPAERYTVRTPVFFPGSGEIRPFAYYHGEAEYAGVTEDFWYPFGLE